MGFATFKTHRKVFILPFSNKSNLYEAIRNTFICTTKALNTDFFFFLTVVCVLNTFFQMNTLSLMWFVENVKYLLF